MARCDGVAQNNFVLPACVRRSNLAGVCIMMNSMHDVFSLASARGGFTLSNTGAASADRPKCLDPPVAHADIPVVQIDGRVAMAGDEPDFFPEPRWRQAWRHRDLAMLVGDRGAL